MTDELSPEEFERLERELSLGRRDWAVRMPPTPLTSEAAAATKGSTAPGVPTFPSSR